MSLRRGRNEIIYRQKRLQRWIEYALDQKTKEIVVFNVGRRTNCTLGVAIKSLQVANIKIIYTNKLKNYGYLINRK